MRFLHTADLHLGKVIHEQSLLEDQEEILDQITTELARLPYDVLIVAGDIFDRSVPSPEALKLWDDFLVRLKQQMPGLVIVVISGNHDGAARLGFASRFLALQNVLVQTEPEDSFVPIRLNLDGKPWDFFAVPFLQPGALAADSAAEGTAPAIRSQGELWETALARLAEARTPSVTSVLVAHLFTQGGGESDSERVFLGEAEKIPPSWLAGWDYAALGHLHRRQSPVPRVHYSGSPLAYSFSEAGDQKVLLSVEWNGDAFEATEIALRPRRPLSRLSSTFDDFLSNPMWEVYREHYLELTLTDQVLVAQPVDRLRARFPRLLSLFQKPEETRLTPLEGNARSTGSLVADSEAFLRFIGFEPGESTLSLLKKAAQETLDETA